MLGAAQLEILDAYCGPEQGSARVATAGLGGGQRRARRARASSPSWPGRASASLTCSSSSWARSRRSIPAEQERAALIAERDRLRNVEGLRAAAWGAQQALADEDAGGLRALLACEHASLEAGAPLDPELEELASALARSRSRPRICSARSAATARGSRPTRDASRPSRSASRRSRASSASTGAASRRVLEHAERCREQRDELVGAEVAMEAAQARLERALREHAAAHARSVAARRRRPALAREVRARLAELAMAEASFEVALAALRAGRAGAEQVAVRDRAEPGRARRAAARDRLRRRALARDAGAAERRIRTAAAPRRSCSTRSTPASAATPRARSASSCARSRRAPDPLRSRTCRRSRRSRTPLHDRQGHSPGADARERHAPGRRAGLGELVRMLGADAGDAGARRHAKELLRAA
jgi:DNA repair protein RecN (Recombination protein N)